MLNIAGQRNISIFSMEACNADTVKYHRVFAISRRNRIFPIFEPSAFLHLYSQFSSLYCFCNYSVEKRKKSHKIFSHLLFFLPVCNKMIWRLAKGRSVRTDWWDGNVTVFDRFWDQSEISSLRDSQIVLHSRIFLVKIFRTLIKLTFTFASIYHINNYSTNIIKFIRSREKIETFTSNSRILGVNDVIPKGEAVEFDIRSTLTNPAVRRVPQDIFDSIGIFQRRERRRLWFFSMVQTATETVPSDIQMLGARMDKRIRRTPTPPIHRSKGSFINIFDMLLPALSLSLPPPASRNVARSSLSPTSIEIIC